MGISESTLLQAWRTVAFIGHHGRFEPLINRESNKIVMYHSIGGGLYDHIAPDRLRRDIEYLKTHYEIVDLPEILQPSETKRIALTFDDGYQDFYANVVPILREYDVPATVFVIADAIDDRSFTHNSRFAYEYMTRDELTSLVDEELVTIGNHTQSHPNLCDLTTAQLEDEIVGAKRRLETVLGTDIRRFSYPFNKLDDRAAAIVRETHEIGVAGHGRRELITARTDPARAPRINGANPFWEVRWDLSDTGTLVGSMCDRVIGPDT